MRPAAGGIWPLDRSLPTPGVVAWLRAWLFIQSQTAWLFWLLQPSSCVTKDQGLALSVPRHGHVEHGAHEDGAVLGIWVWWFNVMTYNNQGARGPAGPKAAIVLTEVYLILLWLCDLEQVIRCFWTSDPSFIKQKNPKPKNPAWTGTSRYHIWPQGTWSPSPWDEYCSYWHQDGGPWGAWLLSAFQFCHC